MEPRPPTLVALADVGYAFSDRTLWYYCRSPPLPPLIVDAIAAVAVMVVAVMVVAVTVVLLAVFFL